MLQFNIKTNTWSHQEILFFENFSVENIFIIWEKLSNKKFSKNIKTRLKKWIESKPDNFNIGIARISPKKCIIIPAEEIKKTTGKYMFINYGGNDETYAYLTNNIKNLYCKLTDNKIIPNINVSNMEIEYTKIK